MSQTISGTFTNGPSAPATPSHFSPELLVGRGVTTARLTTLGCNGSNTMKTQKRTVPGGTFADQTTYNSEQNNVAVTVAEGEEWRIACVALQANYDLRYKLSIET